MSDAESPAGREEILLLYDRDCGFCRVCVGLVLTWDRGRAVVPATIQSPRGERALAELEPAARAGSWHLVDADGRLHSAGAAFEPLLRLLPGGAPLADLVGRSPTATERLYRSVASRRSTFGKLVPAAARRWADERIGERAAAGDPGG